jgi:hypothetical protein
VSEPARLPGRRIDADPETVERGLVTLVLTVVELLRQLMERQALRRVDQGDLSEEKVEQIGATLLALDERMAELREHFGLTPEDLNIDLGPLGPLLPPAAGPEGLPTHPARRRLPPHLAGSGQSIVCARGECARGEMRARGEIGGWRGWRRGGGIPRRGGIRAA